MTLRQPFPNPLPPLPRIFWFFATGMIHPIPHQRFSIECAHVHNAVSIKFPATPFEPQNRSLYLSQVSCPQKRVYSRKALRLLLYARYGILTWS